MALRYLLDTNICIYIARHRPLEVLERFRKLQPGDVVSYFARATDNDAVSGPKSVTSDSFFLQIQPFRKDYRAAEGQASGQQAGQQAYQKARAACLEGKGYTVK